MSRERLTEPGAEGGYADWDAKERRGTFRFVTSWGESVEFMARKGDGLTLSIDSDDAPEVGVRLTRENAKALYTFLSAYLGSDVVGI